MNKKYFHLDGTIGISVFELSEGICSQIGIQDDAVKAVIYRKGSDELLLEYPAYRRVGNQFHFFWDELLYKQCAGWYIVRLMNGSRNCGEHTFRIGSDCYSAFIENKKFTAEECFDISIGSGTGKHEPEKVDYCECPEPVFEESDDCCLCGNLPGIMKFVSPVSPCEPILYAVSKPTNIIGTFTPTILDEKC